MAGREPSSRMAVVLPAAFKTAYTLMIFFLTA